MQITEEQYGAQWRRLARTEGHRKELPPTMVKSASVEIGNAKANRKRGIMRTLKGGRFMRTITIADSINVSERCALNDLMELCAIGRVRRTKINRQMFYRITE